MVRVALCQVLVGDDKMANLDNARSKVAHSKLNGAQIAMLPEMFTCPYSNASFMPYSEPVPEAGTAIDQVDGNLSPTTFAICEMAQKNKIHIIGGSFPERVSVVDEAKSPPRSLLYNTCLVVDDNGKILAKHRKIHLFDINVPGKLIFKESETLTAGSNITVVDLPWFRLGVGICYDMRFAELAHAMTSSSSHGTGATVLAYPGAFNTVTGPLHWELLQRGRALDNQVFVMTCSPARNPSASYQAHGHSSIVNPWGAVIATTSHEPDTVFADLDLTLVDEIRANIPIRSEFSV